MLYNNAKLDQTKGEWTDEYLVDQFAKQPRRMCTLQTRAPAGSTNQSAAWFDKITHEDDACAANCSLVLPNLSNAQCGNRT
jgi:hypothetical protein